MIRLSKDIILPRSISRQIAVRATCRANASLPAKAHRPQGMDVTKEHFVIPDRRSWQHCTSERFQSDASHIPLDRITIGDAGPVKGTSPQ